MDADMKKELTEMMRKGDLKQVDEWFENIEQRLDRWKKETASYRAQFAEDNNPEILGWSVMHLSSLMQNLRLDMAVSLAYRLEKNKTD